MFHALMLKTFTLEYKCMKLTYRVPSNLSMFILVPVKSLSVDHNSCQEIVSHHCDMRDVQLALI